MNYLESKMSTDATGTLPDQSPLGNFAPVFERCLGADDAGHDE